MSEPRPDQTLRYGWTTGSCATAAVQAAYQAILTGTFPDPVEITLPSGAVASFVLAQTERAGEWAMAAVVKDAGDDPDVTHGAVIRARVRRLPLGAGLIFRAGPGVGTVTRPGLPLPPGEPAINPVPRRMMHAAVARIAAAWGGSGDLEIEISIDDGERLALKTMNGRLGIIGGLSVLGTTGIVVPFSCSAWIHAIHRGVDVARAAGLSHLGAATGDTSEQALRAHHGLPDLALIDMGDFVGGLLKYLRRHPVAQLSLAGGFAKFTKLGQGFLDLHSKRGAVDLDWLSDLATKAGGDAALATRLRAANSAKEALEQAAAAGIDLARPVAEAAWHTAAAALGTGAERLDLLVIDRQGALLASTGLRPLRASPVPE